VLFAVIAALPVYGPDRWGAIRALALAIFLAILTECLQSLVPGRHPMLRDGLIDLAGTAAGLAIAAAIRSQRKSPHEAGSLGS
jgi:VanZ family protein